MADDETDSSTAVIARRRGAPAKGEPGARERILATATDLFYREGIRAVGVDVIVAQSGVSKTSLYRSFASKDALIAAVAKEQNRLFWAWWDRVLARHPGDPRAQLAAIMADVAKRIRHPSYRGCPFLNLATEFPDASHPGRVIARANKDELRRRLAELTHALGAREPDRAAQQIALMIDGAHASGLIVDTADLEQHLVGAASAVVAREIAGEAGTTARAGQFCAKDLETQGH
jgi:AcrR family transcriptional regulator